MEKLKMRSTSSGIHIFNRQTGLNLLIDEIVLPSDTWSLAPRQVSIALTNACDLDCPHCYASKSPAILPYDKLTDWLVELDINGCLAVGFGGGEPTLYPKIKELCLFAKENTNLAITMTTHAHHLSDYLLNELAGNLHFIRVSMDGVGRTYESIRGRPFSKLLERISSIKQTTKFGINYVVNSKTIQDLDSAIKIAEELDTLEFLLLPEVSVGRGRGIDQNTFNILKKWVENYRGDIRLSISENASEGFPTSNPFVSENGLAAFAHIDASGLLKRSSYTTNGIEISNNGIIFALDQLKGM